MKQSHLAWALMAFGIVNVVHPVGAMADEIGIAGAVNPDATGQHPARPSHVLKLGDSILFKEKITTNVNGSLQVSFTDGSGMAIGPNATLVIDEYVYDPNKSAAAMSASLVKGALRFVGGAISHDKGMQITTPVATIGVRGGIVTLSFTPATANKPSILDVVHHYGITTVTTGKERFTITEKDFRISIGGNGEIDRGHLHDLAAYQALLATMTSRNTQMGGATSRPDDSLMSRNGVELQRPGKVPFDLTLPQAGETLPGHNLQLNSSPYPCSPWPDCG